ncbi:S-acyl fatty acid synthase thioesterase, medium chain [Erinaceus europaeus]|uniref:oleoyl-[acyl-carrier-protein] hydrolase n=1 Tax=Erinaceus europaeus TaxID=9365 RepID=A0ABM3XH93_ERIEU|nr:S-acyl fatty acid synthase thioesterase, medium chain [Erinaceus europaeus]XP_060048198.1 S-acyl fatty acid synthase thioesterase, medium chain [Erinaceus europaeus]XP_060048199.1 S-acyl fatty acid synthase thioesterase, medium chain [Erinaceus europaeus]
MESLSLPESIEGPDFGGTARNEKVLNCLYQNPGAVFCLILLPLGGKRIHSLCQMGPEDSQFTGSMGAYVAFLTALRLKEKHQEEPMHLFVSSITPPHSKTRIFINEGLSEEEIIYHLTQLGGTPKDIIGDKDFLKHSFPKLKADIYIINKFIFEKPSEPVLSCDLTCFFGSEDKVQNLEAWKDLTSGSFDICKLPGNHFYLLEPSNETFIKNYISKCLELSMIANN